MEAQFQLGVPEDPKAKIPLLLSAKDTSLSINGSDCDSEKPAKLSFGAKVYLGLVAVVSGIFCFTVSPYNLIMEDLLEMRRISPIFPFWQNPPHTITCAVYIFEAVNSREFLTSDDPNVRLELRELGPIVYREFVNHENVTFHGHNDTMSFTSVRRVEFLEDRNEPGILNRSIIVPNFALIGTLSYLSEMSFFAKLAMSPVLSSLDEPLFVNTTVYDFLWNYTSGIVELANKIMPAMVPVTNLGILQGAYQENVDRVNVKIGKRNGFEQFFDIEEYNYQTKIPGYKGECNATVKGSTEGQFYNRHLTNASVIQCYRKILCQVVPLHYDKSSELMGVDVHEYVLRPDSLRRKEDLESDCYKGLDGDVLPDGLMDLSNCYFDFPMVMSLPHFYGYENASWAKKVAGLSPSAEKHESRIFAEPTLGVGIRQYARSQVNTHVRDLSGFSSDYQRFSNLVLPIFWGELMLDEPPGYVVVLIKFVVYWAPSIDILIPVVLILTGLCLILYSLKNK